MQLDIGTLTARQETNNTQSDLARLRGARFAQTSETEEGQQLAEGKLKRITQGMPDGKITATRKYENAIEFNETHKLWMDCNHRPVIRGTENAIWNRLHMVPFAVILPSEEIDPQLPQKLKQEAEGILAWLIEGATAWHRHGLERPPEMEVARAEYRKEMDALGDFIEECCIVNERCTCRSSRLYKAYADWALANNVKEFLDNKAFKRLMETKSFVYKDEKIGIVVHGIGLRADTSEG